MVDIASIGSTAAHIIILMGVGFVCGKSGLFTKEVQKKLTDVVLFVFLPCTIISSFEIHMKNGQLLSFGITFLTAAVLQAFIQIFSYALYRKESYDRKAVLRYATTVCNSGFFGMSILAALYGQEALSYGAIFLIPQRITMWTFSMSYFTKEKENPAIAALKAMGNPNMIAVYIGLVLLLVKIEIPTALSLPIDSFSACTLPITMVLCGSILLELRKDMLKDKTVYFFCFIRLIFIPGIAFAACLLADIPRNIAEIAVLMTGMPAGATSGLLAIKYNGDEKLASTIIAITTILFIAMIPFWLFVAFPLFG
ncbi:MAG: AEC family transporter [Clostridiales Family XIII bacterium]|nr:AEC family transporter [Clostridiales Family XIII bacterium]